jgi:outer membrane receptor protein involved in Fe transport
MRKFPLLGSSALRPVAVIGLSLALAAPAYAQDVADEQDSPEQMQSEAEIESGTNADTGAQGEAAATSDQGITITGTRIRRPNLESAVPITSIGGEEFHQTGQVSIGDVLNELPSLRSTFSQANSTRFLGTAGLNLLDLRGLGTQRTLVLVNGRRHVGSDVLNNAVSPDVNTIPTDLVERVDVVTGGNSAIYGSDAIAGVVNFILKRNFEGVQIRGQGGVSKYGDAGSYFVSATAGTNFADDRGNIAINAEYARQNQFFAEGRPAWEINSNFVEVDTDVGEASDGVADRVFMRDIRSASLSNYGLVRFGGGNNSYRCGTDPNGLGYSCNYLFDAAGNLVPQTGTRVGVVPGANNPTGSFIGGNGENFRGGEQFQLGPKLDRYNVNVIGHFEITPAFVPFIEAKYARTESLGTGSSGPAFIQGSTLGDPAFFLGDYVNREQISINNPFLTPQARQTIVAQRALAGLSTSDATRFSIRLNLLGLGTRREDATRETYRAVGGFRGDFNEDWQYEVSANYGEFKEKTLILGNLNAQRFLLAMDAVKDPATGQIVCASKIDPAARVGYYPDFGNEASSAIFQQDVAACVPINPFGNNISQAARDYVLSDTVATGRIKQFVLNGFLSGDTSQLFELPGGPIGFAVGAEYRREKVLYEQDPLVEQGYTFYNAIPTFSPPTFEVKEVFGEVRLPILRDMPLFQDLTVSAAARISDYNVGQTGTTYAYNAGVEWAPVRDLRFRANYSRAVRAPNLADLFTPLGQNFAPGFADPCAANQIQQGSENRAKNCAAAGIPASFNYGYSASLELQSGGNPDLKEETSDSFTVGGVFTPRFLPGFSLSVDYFDITVNDVITTPTAQQIVDACYDLPDLNNQFCDLFERVPAGGEGPVGEEPFRIVEGSLEQRLLNYAKLTARGVDIEAAYRHRFDFGTVNTRFTYTHMIERDQFLDPTQPTFADQVLLELGDPQDSFNWNVDLQSGPITFGYQVRYIGKQIIGPNALCCEYEDFFSKQGRDPQNPDAANIVFNPAVWYHDARLAIEAGEKFEFYLGVDNITNRKPPFGLTGIGGGSGIYDVRGRFFYAGAVAKF